MPLVSIITAAHVNSAEFIDATIASVGEQVLPPGWELEWIVQEDGAAPAFADRFAEVEGVQFAANTAQLGVASTRNLALARAAGDLVQVLDSDDLLLPDALATLIPRFADPSIHWAVGQADDLMPDGARKAWAGEVVPFGVIPAGSMNAWATDHGGNWPIHCAGLMLRATSLRAVGGWAGTPYDDDIVMFAALSDLADGYQEEAVTWLYRQHAGQLTRASEGNRWSEYGRRIALQRAAAIRLAGLRLAAVPDDGGETASHIVQIGPAAKSLPAKSDGS